MKTPSLSSRSILGSLLLCALATSFAGSETAHARPPKGGYFGLGLGYGIVSGDRGVPLKGLDVGPAATSAEYEEVVRTEFGGGMSLEFRFGYDFGPVAAEVSLFGHGTFDFENGAGYPMLQVRFNPLALIDSMAESKFDANVYVGVGYAIGGYKYNEPGGSDDAGWEGWIFDFGIQGLYQLSTRIHLGLDVKFALPMYSTWIYSRDDDITFDVESTPSTMVIAPALVLVTYF